MRNDLCEREYWKEEFDACIFRDFRSVLHNGPNLITNAINDYMREMGVEYLPKA